MSEMLQANQILSDGATPVVFENFEQPRLLWSATEDMGSIQMAGNIFLFGDYLQQPYSVERERNQCIETEFHALTEEWRRETMLHSSLGALVVHPAYQRVMAMGSDVLPLILRELRVDPDHWFYALKFIVGRDVAEGATNFDEATAAWLEWGYRNNYL